jgi:hypothetical protein
MDQVIFIHGSGLDVLQFQITVVINRLMDANLWASQLYDIIK